MSKASAFKGTYGTMYYVRNMKKSVAFYRDVIGLKPDFEDDGWTQFSVGGAALCLHAAGDTAIVPAAPKSASNGIVILEVEDIRGMVGALKEKRVEFTGDLNDTGCGWCTEFKDLDGNLISLYQRKPANPDQPAHK